MAGAHTYQQHQTCSKPGLSTLSLAWAQWKTAHVAWTFHFQATGHIPTVQSDLSGTHWTPATFYHLLPSKAFLWAELCVSPARKSYTEVLTHLPSPQNVITFGDRIFKEVDYVKMRSWEWILIQYDWCPSKKREFEHKPGQKKDDVKTGEEEDV